MVFDLLVAAGTAAYVLATLLLFIFGANLARFAIRLWNREVETDRDPQPEILPSVTVQIPIYNEFYVAQRIIEAVCALDYPRHLLEIQVLDDSTDETSLIIERVVAAAVGDGHTIEHLQRRERTGYKAGALAAGLESASGEMIAIFDADFLPEPDFLLRAVAGFDGDDVAFVQGRWGHLNRGFSWLTRLQALAIDAHFLIEQTGRGTQGYWFNFNGTAGVWRKSAIVDAGGWTADTLTEDLDLSYRAHLRGWRGRYLENLVIPAELPSQVMAFRRQQHRWARGSIECARKLLSTVWRSNATFGVKAQASLHLLAYSVHLLLMVILLTYPALIVAGDRYAGLTTLFGFGYLLAITSLAPALFLLAGQRRGGRNLLRQLPNVLLVSTVGAALMVNTTRAVIQIFTTKSPEFERTAKLGLDAQNAERRNTRRYQLGVDYIVVVELALAVYAAGVAWFAFDHQNWGVFGFATMFGIGLGSVAVVSLVQVVRTWLTSRAALFDGPSALDEVGQVMSGPESTSVETVSAEA